MLSIPAARAPAPSPPSATAVEEVRPGAGAPEVNVFSSPEYLSCVAEACYPGRRFDLVDYAVAGATYRLLRILPRGLWPEEVLTRVPTLDPLEPVAAPGRPGPGSLPIAYRGTDAAATWRDRAVPAPLQLAPLVDLERFPAWDDLLAHARRLPGETLGLVRARQARTLDREHGLAMTWRDESAEALAAWLAWRSQPFRRLGLGDSFQADLPGRLLPLLRARGQLLVSSARWRGALVAVHVGLVHRGRFHSWLPAAPPTGGPAAVGAFLLEWMLEESHRRGLREFDFPVGSGGWVWSYATHTRLVGPVGTEPRLRQVWRPLRSKLLARLRRAP